MVTAKTFNSFLSSKKEVKEEFAAMQEIYKLVQLNPLTSTGSSLLHLTVNQQTPVGGSQ